MPVKGLLITLDEDSAKAASATAQLRAHEGIELGEQKERYLPVVIDVDKEPESRQLYYWIEALEGVYFVDTVFSSVDSPEQGSVI